jgi:hypothetical protein
VSQGPDCSVFDEVILEENDMPETVEAVLWCAALATWLMMLFTIVRQGVKKIIDLVRGRVSRRGKAPRSPFEREGRQSRETWRPE